MTEQSEALRLAECLDEPDYCTILQMRQAAAELRRLHEENIQARRTSEYWKAEHLAGNDRIAALEKALGMAVEALESINKENLWWGKTDAALATARQTLGGKHG